MAEQKLAMSLDDLIAQSQRPKKKPQPKAAAPKGPALTASGPRKNLQKARRGGGPPQNGAGDGGQQAFRRQPQQQQPQQRARVPVVVKSQQRGRDANLGVARGGVQKRQGPPPPRAREAPPPQRARAQENFEDRRAALDGNARWKHDKFEGDAFRGPRSGASSSMPTTKLIINNLHTDVNDNDLLELFATVGQVTLAKVNYDNSDRSIGSASVTFTSEAEAKKAKQLYDGVALDGQPMHITFAGAGGAASIPSQLKSGIRVGAPAGSGGGKPAAASRVTGVARHFQQSVQRSVEQSAHAPRALTRPGGAVRGGRLRSAVVSRANQDDDDEMLE